MPTYFYIIICSIFFISSCGKIDQIKNFGVPPGMTVTATTPVDYQSVKNYSLGVCLNCHRDRVLPDLTSYKTVLQHIDAVGEKIDAGDMPPQDEGYDALSECQVSLFKQWLDRGMPEKDGTPLTDPQNCY